MEEDEGGLGEVRRVSYWNFVCLFNIGFWQGPHQEPQIKWHQGAEIDTNIDPIINRANNFTGVCYALGISYNIY